MNRLSAALCGIAALALGGCAIKPVLEQGQAAQIVEVTVTTEEKDLPTTDNFLEEIRVRTQNAAYRFSEEGPEKTLNLKLTWAMLHTAGGAMFVAGGSFVSAEVKLVDRATGTVDSEFPAGGHIERLGGIIGALSTIGIDPIEEEQNLAGKLAEDVMRRIYGAEYAATVAERTPTQQATATYPMSYDDARAKLNCIAVERANREAESEAERTGIPGTLEELPANCAALMATQ